MSAFLLGTGFRADMGTCIRKLVLLKLIDACEDDGSRIFPAIATVARAAQCSDRQVQREIRAFLDIGLLSLVRAGGQGRRSTNEYALDLDVLSAISKAGWDAYAASRGLTPKGDTQSPLDDDAKGDTGDPDRVTPETPKGDNGSPPTPLDPSLDPSIERERGREDDLEEKPEGLTKRAEALFFRSFTVWDRFAVSPKAPMLDAWGKLTWTQMTAAADAVPRFLAAKKAAGMRHAPAISTYLDLAERLWEGFPPPEKPHLPSDFAPPFGPVWSGWCIGRFVQGVENPDGTTDAERWPLVDALYRKARLGQGHRFSERWHSLKPMMEAVPVNSPCFEDWRLEYERRAWPWIPDPGSQPVVYFPAGGPGALSEFEAAVRGTRDDAGGREAAE